MVRSALLADEARLTIMILPLLLSLLQNGTPVAGEVRTYSAWLTTEGKPLYFGIELRRRTDAWQAFLVNGEERVEVPRVEFDQTSLLLDMPHYDSRIRATVSEPDGLVLDGTWEKRRGPESIASMPFHGRALTPSADTDGPPAAEPFNGVSLSGRWSVEFEGEKEPAVCVLEQRGAELSGTFLTATGDYRYLSGIVEATQIKSSFCAAMYRTSLTLSCFDGAHAFLFEARLINDDTLLYGDFYSGNWHHQVWRARRDDSAQLADPFAQTKWNGTTKLADLSFPDLDGKSHALSEFAGKATLLVVFGSWCPNCNDEAKLLRELDAKYRERGLRILPLAFELTGEFARDAAQVRIFQQRHALELPFFLCGTADKDEATKALGLVDHVRAFPTTVFVGADGLVKAVHSGFAGPATGEEHTKLVREFEERLEALLR